MQLRDLTYLLAVAEHSHFGRAAQACHVSQPALSMQIKKLEDMLGVQLFERSNKQVRITQAGQEIAARAQAMMAQWDDIRRLARTHHDPLAGEFRLGAFPTLAPYYLPKAVPVIHRRLPKLRLLLTEEKTARLLAMLHDGELDAALIALPVESPLLVSAPLFHDPFFLAVPAGHRMAKWRSAGMQDIAGERLLLLEEGHCLREQSLAVCHLAAGPQQEEFRATSLETLRQMVVAGGGVTLIPGIAIGAEKNIRYVPIRGNAAARTIGLVWRRQGARRGAAEALAALLKR